VRRLVFTPTAEINLVETQEHIARRSGNIATAEAFIMQLFCKAPTHLIPQSNARSGWGT
jgi:hypothetical protein